jgi:hypothetical protein
MEDNEGLTINANNIPPEELEVYDVVTEARDVNYEEQDEPLEEETDIHLWTEEEYKDAITLLDGIATIQREQSQTLDALKSGVNTIGEMMNGVASAFEQIVAEVQKGGLGGLLGTVMGGKK